MVEKTKLPISVLIVDDEPSIVEQLALILSRRVEVFYKAFNGKEGYECYQREHPDLIISDIDMPVMNGIEFLKLVRSHDRHLPFILSTGLKSLDILIEAIEQGITAFLPKPLQIQGLITKIEEVAHTKALEIKAKTSALLLDQYKKIVDDSVIVSKTNTKGIITYVNDMFCSISGYTRDELIGQSHNIVRDPSMDSSIFKEIWKTIESKRIWHGIIHNRAKNGNRYTVKTTIAPILDDKGNIVEYIALREDVTDLEQAKNEAKQSAKIKGDFLANMSHEIRTPMNGILGFTDLLARSNLDEKQKRYLDIIKGSTHSLLGIINDILDFSKLESGKFELDFTPINPMVEFNKIAQLFSAKMEEKHILFDVEIDSKISECIFIDLLRIQQVISNLLNNASKFTPENGHIEFYAKFIKSEGDKNRIRIGVIDNGIGITPQQQKKIFEAFSQADSATTRQFGGTGLGLSISSHLVSLMGGDLQVESKLGKGSHFFFELSVKKCIADKEGEVKDINNLSDEKVSFCGKVLIAEDNQVNQLLIKEYLQQYNIGAEIVENGKEALDRINNTVYDLIFMDINMPVMSGVEAVVSIKEKKISTPIIALTANAMAGDKEKFLNYGFDDYLSKPIVPKQLEEILQRYLSSNLEHNDLIAEKETPEKETSPMAIVNMALLKKELALSDKILYKLLTVFLESSDKNLLEIDAAVNANDFKKLESIAHKIKGAAGNMHFYPVEKLSGEIETLARFKKNANYKKLCHELKNYIKKVQEEIKEILTQ